MFKQVRWAWGISAISLIIGLVALSLVDSGEKLPVHFDIDGNPDRYGNPFMALLGLPLINMVSLLVVAFVRRFDPRQQNAAASDKSMAGIMTVMALFLAIIHLAIILSVFKVISFSGLNVYLLIGLLLIVIGNFLPKTRSNFFLGIRTPWTLSSETVWRKTHQLGGPLMVAGGAIISVASLVLGNRESFYTFMGVVGIVALVPTIYSLILWQREQH